MKSAAAILVVFFASVAWTPAVLSQTAPSRRSPAEGTAPRQSPPTPAVQAQKKLTPAKNQAPRTVKFMIPSEAILDVSRFITIMTHHQDVERLYWVLHYAGASGWLDIERQGMVIRKLPFAITGADTLKFDAPPREPIDPQTSLSRSLTPILTLDPPPQTLIFSSQQPEGFPEPLKQFWTANTFAITGLFKGMPFLVFTFVNDDLLECPFDFDATPSPQQVLKPRKNGEGYWPALTEIVALNFLVNTGVRERRDEPAYCRGCKSPTGKEKRFHPGLESCAGRREAAGEA